MEYSSSRIFPSATDERKHFAFESHWTEYLENCIEKKKFEKYTNFAEKILNSNRMRTPIRLYQTFAQARNCLAEYFA